MSMHVFCDESGGLAPAEHQFSVAAVAVEPRAAEHAIKRFRRAAGWAGEVKGTRMKPDQRVLFFSIAAEAEALRGVAVTCARAQGPVARWVFRELRSREHVLYGRMLAEAFDALGTPSLEVLGVTADQKRYRREQEDAVARELDPVIARLAGRPVPFAYGDSASTAGLQVADVICNTAGQFAAGEGQLLETAAKAVEPLLAAGRLVLTPARLDGLAPDWLRTEVCTAATRS